MGHSPTIITGYFAILTISFTMGVYILAGIKMAIIIFNIIRK
jgi:hypothetical protein